jgi:HK97 family phage portal protein
MLGNFRTTVSGLFPRWGGSGLGSRLLYLLPGARLDYQTEAGNLWENSIVALALQWKADRYTRMPIRVSKINVKTGNYDPLPRHPLVDLWSRPSPHFARRSVEAAVGMSLDVDGNGYLQKVRSKGGKVVELWWQPHFNVEPQWPADGETFVGSYAVSVDGAQYELDPADVVHFRRGIDPSNVRLGLAPLRACLREVCTINEESGYTASLLRNSAVPGLAIVPDSDNLRPSKDDAAAIKERVSDAFTGDNRGQTLVLAGKYKVQPIGWSPEQLTLDKLPLAAIARVAGSLGVAPMSMGLSDPNKTYANLAESNKASWAGVISIQGIVAETIRWSLLPEFGTDPYGYVVEYDYSNIDELQESLDSLHTRVREDYKAGVMQLNEARDLMGLPSLPDGDRLVTEGGPANPFGVPMIEGQPKQPPKQVVAA